MRRNFSRGRIAAALLLFLGFIPAERVYCQSTESAYWVRYQNQIFFSGSFYSNIEIDNRRFFHPNVPSQFIAHTKLHYKTGRLEFAGGLTGSWAYASNPVRPVSHPTTEFRPVVEVSYESPFKKGSLHQRLRLDNRFIEEDRFASLADGAFYNARFRYRLQVKLSLYRDSQLFRELNLRIADEIMLNSRENLFDQNRVYVTADLSLNRNITIETGYIHIYQQRFGTEEFAKRHVLRLTLLHKIFLY